MSILRVYDSNFNLLYATEKYLKMTNIERYWGRSVLQASFAKDNDACAFLQRNCYLVDEADIPYIIRYRKKKNAVVDVTAFGMHYAFEGRITRPNADEYAIEKTGSPDAVVKEYITRCFPTGNRSLPIVCAPVQDGEEISDQSRLKNLGNEVIRVLGAAGRGEKFTFDAENKQIIFDTFTGTDRTQGNVEGNPTAVFDEDYRNIEDSEYTEDASGQQSTVYVGGAGEGTEREIHVTGDEATGWDRREVFVDARDIPAGDTDKLSARGAQAVIGVKTSLAGKLKLDSNLAYNVDFFMGDQVSVNVEIESYEEDGEYFEPITERATINTRIIEVTKVYENSEMSIDISYGDAPTITQVSQVSTQVDQLKSTEASGIPKTPNVQAIDEADIADNHIVIFDKTNKKLRTSGIVFSIIGAKAIAPALNTDLYIPQWDGTDSKTLKDGLRYEEGTFQPYFAGSTTDGTYTYGIRTGYFKRLDDLVYFSLRLEISGVISAATGSPILIKNLPFAAKNIGEYAFEKSYPYKISLGTGAIDAMLQISGNSTVIGIYGAKNNDYAVNSDVASLVVGSGARVSGWYRAAS